MIVLRIRYLGIALAILTLAGCDAMPGQGLLDPTAQTAAPASEQSAVAPVGATAPPPELAKLHNMSAADVEALVGEPDFRRVEPPAELWQYRTANCVVDLFLYDKDGGKRVIHEDARGRDPTGAGSDQCGGEVLSHRQRASLIQ
jgi:hypothetical protein